MQLNDWVNCGCSWHTVNVTLIALGFFFSFWKQQVLYSVVLTGSAWLRKVVKFQGTH